MPLQKEPPFVHGLAARTAVVLMNLGTPDAPTPGAVRRYLRQFLSDPRVVELPRLLWLPLLHGVILPLRARQSAAKYASIWARDGGRAVSPLLLHTERQAAALQQALGNSVIVTHAMRYGTPSFAQVLRQLREQGAERLLLLPMYPQYSGSTTASAYDDAFAALAGLRNQPAVRTIRSYHDDPGYIGALRAQVEQHWAAHGRPDFAAGDTLVLTFHGVPRRMLDAGDPYHCHCLKTGRLLGEALGLTPGQYRVTFQSRFGRAQWLTPYTAQTLEELGRAGTRRVDVFCPGFPADCLETLEEIAQEGRELFVHAGGGDYHYIACVNDAPVWIDALARLARANLQGWLDQPAAAELAASRQRAQAAGATE